MSHPTSAFNWHLNPRPSIFATDGAFTPNKTSGKTQSQTTSEAVERFTKRTGRSPGSIAGISRRGNLIIEESNHQRRAG